MNEEEKKAIETVNELTVYYNNTSLLDEEELEEIKNNNKSIETVLNLIKKLQKENEAVKQENDKAWEEWNNLEQWSYETEQRLKQQIKKLQKENESLQKTYNDCYCKYKHYKQFESIPIQKVKDKIKEIQKEYNKLDEQVEEYINDVNKDLSKYYENKERIAIMQTLAYFIDTLQELIEERREK